MAEINWEKIGFKCGVEVHQQLDVGKLYCKCPSVVRDSKKPDIHFTRRLRAVIGETGEIDPAAAYEMSKGKYYVYDACSTSSCLVDMDEEPPHEMNKEALLVGLQVAKVLHARIVDEIQIMRKIVVDGSNVSGFQRTALIATNGYIETSKGRVGIPTICVEEESAQKIEATEGYVKYRLDRLGVPLIEIATAPDIKDSEHAKEVAEHLGMILRSTGKAKRGLGSIRQDVNVSIAGGKRVEIKGFQDLKSIPKVIVYEIHRHEKLLSEGKEVGNEVRKAEPDLTTSFLRPMPGAARMYPETDMVPMIVTPELIEEAREVELISEKEERFLQVHKLGKDLAKKIAKNEFSTLFESLIGNCKQLKPAFIAETLVGFQGEIQRKHAGSDVHLIKERHLVEIFQALDKGKIAKESLMDILENMATGNELNISQYALMDDEKLREELKKIISSHKGIPFNALIGKAMGVLRGKANGNKIVSLLKQLAG